MSVFQFSSVNSILLSSSTHSLIPKTRLEAAYKSLATGLNKKTFAQLEEEVDREELEKENFCEQLSMTSERCTSVDLEELLFQRDSGSPMEASPADQPTQANAIPPIWADLHFKNPIVLCKRENYTVSRLVVEPDSQASSRCTTALEELEPEVRRKKTPQTLSASNEKDRQCRGTDKKGATPTQKSCVQANRTRTR